MPMSWGDRIQVKPLEEDPRMPAILEDEEAWQQPG
jgi:hypothetical protein